MRARALLALLAAGGALLGAILVWGGPRHVRSGALAPAGGGAEDSGGARIVAAPASREARLLLVETPSAVPPFTIAGEVVGVRGRYPAEVYVGARFALVDRGTGRFEVPLDPQRLPAPYEDLVVVERGAGFAVRHAIGAVVEAGGGRAGPERVTLQSARLLRGVVVDARGEPVEGALVGLADGTPVGYTTAEALAARRAFPVHTDAGGRFALPGLGPRAYTLRVAPASGAGMVEAGPFEHTHEDVRVLLPDVLPTRSLSVHVVSRAGRSLPGVEVRLLLLPDRAARGRARLQLARNTTGDDGLLSFDAPLSGVVLSLSGDRILPVLREVRDGRAPVMLRVAVVARIGVAVEWPGSWERLSRLVAIGPEGQPLLLARAGGGLVGDAAPLLRWEERDGLHRSDRFLVPEVALEAVLESEAGVLLRTPLYLGQGQDLLLTP
jgi:hypothetical protein